MDYNGSYTIMTVLVAAYPKVNGLKITVPALLQATQPPLTPIPLLLPPAVRATHFSSRRLSITLCLPEADWKNLEKSLLEKLLEKVPLLDQIRLLSLEF